MAVAKPAYAGSTPTFKRPLVFGQPNLSIREAWAVSRVLHSRWIGTGPRVAEFEKRFADYVEAENAVAVSSCTAALHAALVACDIGRSDQVITSTLTFPATVQAIELSGATPVLVDVEDNLNIKSDEVEGLLRLSNVKAVIPVHFGGLPCSSNLRTLTERRGITLIEDAAHAIGAMSGGRFVGSQGIACFSFYPTKNITTGEGGMIVTDDEELAKELRSIRIHGVTTDAWQRFTADSPLASIVVRSGFKYNMTDIQAALGLTQLSRLGDFTERRREVIDVYESALIPGITACQSFERSNVDRHAMHLYVVRVNREEFGLSRDQLLAALRAENIDAGVHYFPVHLHAYYAHRFNPKNFPNATRLSEEVLSLPLSNTMSKRDAKRVVYALQRIQTYAKEKW